MTEPEFLESETVSFLHDQALLEYGGMPGMRDRNLLESALARLRNKQAYAEAGTLDLFDLAAAYAFGIAANHAFNDANKRTAWACCVAFLRLNGADVAPPEAEILERIPRLAARELDEAAFAAWLRARAR